VATDLSQVALERGRARAPELPITWLVDDITDSRLGGGFQVAVDRGCLHHLPETAAPRWAHTLARLVSSGGVLLVKTDAPTAGHGLDLSALLAPAFDLVEARPCAFPGRGPATLAVLRRR
jgi:hypothetical protein